MSYKSGHIYLVDKEPTNEELANFSKPVQFDICKDGLFYSILYDKNGNRYVEDRSKITTGFIKLGNIVRVGNVTNIGVHPSGFNHWRINGVDVTSSNPATLELEPETNLYRIDSIVGNGAGGLFIFQGDADKNPIPLNPLNYPNYAFFKDVLITPNTGGSIDPEILNNYVSKEEENWKTITVSAGTNFSINITDKRTRFKVRSTNDIPKVLQSIVFSEETSRALEIWIYNDTNLNFSIPNSATNGLSKGFTTAQPPFIILPKTYEKLKYNPETNIIECWKVNSTSGGISTVTTDSTLKGKGSPTEPLGISDAKNAEIAGKATQTQLETKQDKSMFSALVDKWIHFYDSATAKMQPIIKLVTGAINQLEFEGRMKIASLILPPNSSPNVANRLWSDGTDVYYDDSLAIPNRLAKDKQIYKTISSDTTLDDSFHNAIVFISGTCTIVVPNTLRSGFTCVFDVLGNFTATFTEGGTATFSAPYGKTLRNNRMCTISKRTATQYRLNGNLATV